MTLVIRHATQKDATLIADISRQTFYETFSGQNSKEDMDIFLGTQFTRGRLMLEVGRAGKTFLIAEDDNVVAGYAKLNDQRQPANIGSKNCLEIARLYAVKGMIGKGVGSFLMEEIVKIATEQKKEMLWLGVWKENERAIAFYRKWGFEVFDECDFILGNDLQKDWMMKKKL
jgi:ribosomal protein S18 acetylase RimI-like enzyme